MFLEIDFSKRKEKARYYLAKPNGTIISHIGEKFNDKLKIKLGDINELNFSIPYYIVNDDGVKIKNKHIDLIREKMLIKVKLNKYEEWFIIDEIEEDGEEDDVFNVTAFSRGYELRNKTLYEFTEDSIGIVELANKILEKTSWTVGHVDPIFLNLYRSFEVNDDDNILDAIRKVAETFNAVIVWDTEKRQIHFRDIANIGKFRGLTINYGKLLRSIKRNRITDEMVTRLYVYGNDGLTISNANPTGMEYIEDFSFFMYPFEMDENGNVIKSSYYMSDNLCKAIINHQSIVSTITPQIKSYLDDKIQKQTQLLTEETKLNELQLELNNIIGLLDIAKATGDNNLIQQRTQEKQQKEMEVTAQRGIVNNLKTEIQNIDIHINDLQQQIQLESNFTPELLEELNYYIIEKKIRDDNYVDEHDLYEYGLQKFNEIRQPKVVIEASIENLFNSLDYQYYWDKIVLGDDIKVKYPQMDIDYMAKIIEIEYDFENEEINFTIANTKELLNDMDELKKLLYQSQSASTLIQNNKYKWNKINIVEQQVIDIVSSEWDATKNKIVAGVNNSIEVGNRGIIITNPDFPNEMIIIQSGVVALSKDNGETWKTAITPDGVVAERLIGQIIAGQELIITNSSGTLTIDTNGIRINAEAFIVESQSGSNLVEKWINTSDFIDEFKDDGIITPYEKKMIKKEWDKIVDNYNANYEKIQYFYGQNQNLQFINDYYNAYQELYNYLFVDLQGDKPLLADNNMNYSTRIDNNTFEQKFRNYYLTENELEKQLSIKAKDLADTATQLAQEAQQNINEVMDDVVYKIELISSNGLVFRNNNIYTTITARVYRGKDDITDTLPPSAFIWKKYDKDGNLDTAWTNAHAGVGNVITVTELDVQQRTTFKCEIDIV